MSKKSSKMNLTSRFLDLFISICFVSLGVSEIWVSWAGLMERSWVAGKFSLLMGIFSIIGGVATLLSAFIGGNFVVVVTSELKKSFGRMTQFERCFYLLVLAVVVVFVLRDLFDAWRFYLTLLK